MLTQLPAGADGEGDAGHEDRCGCQSFHMSFFISEPAYDAGLYKGKVVQLR